MASFAGPPEDLEISEEMPVDEMADRIYEYWKIYKWPSLLFNINVKKIMKPILMTAGSKPSMPLEILPSEKYKDFLSYFSKKYKEYPDKFIKELFTGTFEENNISGVIRIVANQHDYDLVDNASSEVVYIDSDLLEVLRGLNNIEPLIFKEGLRIIGRKTIAKNATISNTIIILLNNKRLEPVIPVVSFTNRKRKRNNKNTTKRRITWRGGTRKRGRKLKTLKKRR